MQRTITFQDRTEYHKASSYAQTFEYSKASLRWLLHGCMSEKTHNETSSIFCRVWVFDMFAFFPVLVSARQEAKDQRRQRQQGDATKWNEVLPAYVSSRLHDCCWVREFVTIFRMKEALSPFPHKGAILLFHWNPFPENLKNLQQKFFRMFSLNFNSYLTVKVVALIYSSYKETIKPDSCGARL